jgi:(2Fe-2S) ferredoxin
MDTSPLPFESMVFVCTNQRAPGERVACANPGRAGQTVLDELKKGVLDRGLKGRVRVCKSGCQDRCEEGPNVVIVQKDGVPEWRRNVGPGDAPAILERLARSHP